MLFHSQTSLTYDKSDLRRTCRVIMNNCVKQRLISKQEATVLLRDLELVNSTETIESVSISNSVRFTVKADDPKKKRTLLQEYMARPLSMEKLNLYEFFIKTKNDKTKNNQKTIVPNFVGLSNTATYPPTKDYARYVLICYKPWREYPKKNDPFIINDFHRWMNSSECPPIASLPYLRAFNRHLAGTTHFEPKSPPCDHSGNPISSKDQELMDICSLKATEDEDHEWRMLKALPKGEDYDWSASRVVSK